MVDNPEFAVWISTLSVVVPEIELFPVLAAISLLPVVCRGCCHLDPFFSELYAVETPDLPLDFPVSAAISCCRTRTLLKSFRGTLFELAVVENLGFGVGIWMICHAFGDISTSGFGGHIVISGCRSSSRLLPLR